MSHSTTERELRQAILDAPNDVAVRLVYADHLIERGDPRGDFIVLDCAREGEDDAQELRRRALWQHHASTWLTEDLGFDHGSFHWSRNVDYRDGFADHVHLSMTELLQREALLARQPIRSLSLTQLYRDLDRMVDSPVLDRVRALAFDNSLGMVDAQTVVRFLSSPRLARLEELEVDGEGMPALWDALRTCPRLPQLRRLSLNAAALAPEPARWLAEHLPALETFHSHVSLDGPALRAFAEAAPFRLRELYVSDRAGDALDDDAIAELLGTPMASQLATLSLGRCRIGERARDVLARLPCAPTLRRLVLAFHGAPSACAAMASELPALESVNLAGNALDDDHARLFAGRGALRDLELGSNALTERGVAAILEQAPRLRSLGLADCAIGDAGGIAIAATPSARALRTLDLAGTGITSRAIAAIGTLVDLRELDVDHVGADGVRMVADAGFDKMARLGIPNDRANPIQHHFARAWLPHWKSRTASHARLLFERRLDP